MKRHNLLRWFISWRLWGRVEIIVRKDKSKMATPVTTFNLVLGEVAPHFAPAALNPADGSTLSINGKWTITSDNLAVATVVQDAAGFTLAPVADGKANLVVELVMPTGTVKQASFPIVVVDPVIMVING